MCHWFLIPPTCISSWSYLSLHLHIQNAKGPNQRLSIICNCCSYYLWSKIYCSPKKKEKTQFISTIYRYGSFFSPVINVFFYTWTIGHCCHDNSNQYYLNIPHRQTKSEQNLNIWRGFPSSHSTMSFSGHVSCRPAKKTPTFRI